jgi:hypothetical protein
MVPTRGATTRTTPREGEMKPWTVSLREYPAKAA